MLSQIPFSNSDPIEVGAVRDCIVLEANHKPMKSVCVYRPFINVPMFFVSAPMAPHSERCELVICECELLS